MDNLKYTVSIWDNTFNEWCMKAAFQWFTDARSYALRISKADKLDRLVVVERRDDQVRPSYFKAGAAVYDLEDAA